jgi:hypothetical protein
VLGRLGIKQMRSVAPLKIAIFYYDSGKMLNISFRNIDKIIDEKGKTLTIWSKIG